MHLNPNYKHVRMHFFVARNVEKHRKVNVMRFGFGSTNHVFINVIQRKRKQYNLSGQFYLFVRQQKKINVFR